MNEESVQNCLNYFHEAKSQQQSKTYEPVQHSMQITQQRTNEQMMLSRQLQEQQQMRHDLEQLRELAGSISTGVNNAVAEEQNFQMTMGQQPNSNGSIGSNGLATFQQRESMQQNDERLPEENEIADFTRE